MKKNEGGTIPSSLNWKVLSCLESLNLAYNGLVGTVPSFSGLNKLKRLELFSNGRVIFYE